jgi:hypothetical protein
LSLGGVFIETESPEQFKIGDKIHIVMTRSADKGKVEAVCRVIRVTKNGIGIEFVG